MKKTKWAGNCNYKTLKSHLMVSSPRCSVSKENERRVSSALPLCVIPGPKWDDSGAVKSVCLNTSSACDRLQQEKPFILIVPRRGFIFCGIVLVIISDVVTVVKSKGGIVKHCFFSLLPAEHVLVIKTGDSVHSLNPMLIFWVSLIYTVKILL